MTRVVLHQARKDLRAVRPWLALWLGLVLANVAAMLPAVDLFAQRHGARGGFLAALTAVSLAQVALGVAVVVRVIHADSAAETTAFWLTRPVGSRAVLAAKLLVIGGLIGMDAGAHLVALLFNSLEPAAVRGVLGEIALGNALVLLPMAVVASLTRDTTRLVLAGLAFLFAFAVSRLVALNMIMYPRTEDGPLSMGAGVVWLALLGTAWSLACLAHQYVTRRTARTMTLLATGLVAALVLGMAAPLRPVLAPRVADAWTGGQSVAASLTLSSGAAPHQPGATSKRYLVSAALDLRGVPAGFLVRPHSLEGVVRYEDGFEARTTRRLWSGSAALDSVLGHRHDVTAAASHALGATVFRRDLAHVPAPYERLLLASLDADQADRRRTVGARYDGTLRLDAYRPRVVAVIPPTVGQAVSLSSRRLTIAGLVEDEDGRSLSIRDALPKLLWQGQDQVNLALVLVNRARNEALPGAMWSAGLGRLQEAMWPFYLWVRASQVRFSRVLPDGRTLEPGWFAGAELAVLVFEPAGTFTTRVTIDDVRIAR